jgi:thiamine-phosphate pyrophosphorylase
LRLPALYPILDLAVLQQRKLPPLDVARVLLNSGAGILQLREKGPLTAALLDLARNLSALCREASVPFVVNDRADLALLCDAHLHLGQDDLPPAAARTLLGAEKWIGYSTHNQTQFSTAEQEAVDYLAIGPVFATASKENPDPTLGMTLLHQLRRSTSHPLVAIGGITRDNALSVFAAGVDSVAVIGDLYPAGGGLRETGERLKEWQSLLKSRSNQN